MSRLILAPDQQSLKDQVKEDWKWIINSSKENSRVDKQEFTSHLEGMAQKAHQLHVSLKEGGNEPRHNKYVLKNRGFKPDEPEFYKHVHAVEDLLKFIDNTSANDDPVDNTINDLFKFKIFTRRWGHADVYDLKRTKMGWDISFMGEPMPCDKSGRPGLFRSLNHDWVDYPNDLGGYFEWLWNKARDDGLTKKQVQEALDELSNWVMKVEDLSPKTKLWKSYK